ncbi:MAG: hypothetical protein K0V04_30125 [Deltaproteobacteria bacterium]|nr:hypothetical protein [Deltaproteobacteria bacterium]
MPRIFLVSLLLLVSCDSTPAAPATSAADAKPVASAEGPIEAKAEVKAEPKIDPLLAKVCAAYDEEVAANPSPEQILSRTALRAVSSHGVSEAQLASLGGQPAQLLASIRERGDPPQCKAFAAAIERVPPPR